MAVRCIAAAPGYAKIVPVMRHLVTIHNHGPTSSRQWEIPDVRGKIRRRPRGKTVCFPHMAHAAASGQGCDVQDQRDRSKLALAHAEASSLAVL